jgi:EmrB/QacA subfamily drug resistance transporter
MAENRKTRNRILLVATLSAFLTPFMGSSLNLAIPAIGQDLNGNAIMLNWIVTSFLLVSAAFLLPFGRLADMRGHKRLFVAGIGVFGLASFLCAMTNSMILLLLARILQGLGAAMMFATGTAILTASFPPQDRGKVLGINAGVVYIGLSAGPILGGFLTHYLGWRSIFYMVALWAVVVIWAAQTRVPDDSHPAGEERYDTLGAVLVSFSIIAIIYGASSLYTLSVGPALTMAGVVGLALFVFQEFRSPYPILNVKVLARNTAFAFSNLAALINYSATFSISYLLSLYLQVVRGFGAQSAGTLLLIQPLVMAILSPIAGRLSDRLQPRVVSSVGMAITAAGLVVLATIRQDTDVGIIAGILVLQGLGFALFASPNTNAIMSSVERRYYGVASSTMGTMRLVGQALSMAIVSFIFAANLGQAKIGPEVTSELLTSTNLAFIVFAVMCAVGIFCSLARGNVSRGEEGPS